MEYAKVIFSFNGERIAIQCYKDDKMKMICQRFSTMINKDFYRLFYIYRGEQINLESKFNDQINPADKISNEMNIYVGEKDFFAPECWEKNRLKTKKDNDILSDYIGIKDKKKKKKHQIKKGYGKTSFNSINLKLNKNYDNHEKILDNIKSKYITEIVFSYLSESKKLKIIKHNKKLQNQFMIKLINYKLLSGRYILYESNDNGKEYYFDNDKLLFEGKYKNGERNGLGKEYNSKGKIIFEGEYLKGKRWKGKGKYYNKYDDLISEVEYLNGEINGKANSYYYDGKLKFEAEFLNGELNGKAKEYGYDGELIHEAKYLNGYIIDFKEYDKSKKVLNEIKNGKGILREFYNDGKLKYEYEFFNGERNGKAKDYYGDGKLKFEGDYLNGNIWNGKVYDKNNNINELKFGKGFYKEYCIFNGKLMFEGEYLNGERNGKGKEYDYFDDKLIFEGEYLNGQRNGKGKEYDYYGNIIFEGVYFKGRRWKGKYRVYANSSKSLIFESEYLNGEINGTAKEYYYDRTSKFEGIYLYGYKLIGKEFYKGKKTFEGEYFYFQKDEEKDM